LHHTRMVVAQPSVVSAAPTAADITLLADLSAVVPPSDLTAAPAPHFVDASSVAAAAPPTFPQFVDWNGSAAPAVPLMMMPGGVDGPGSKFGASPAPPSYDPFSGPTGAMAGDVFGAPAAGPVTTNSMEPFGAPAGGADPFASPAHPFGAPPPSGTVDPFGAPIAAGGGDEDFR
jgi:hypothetical protein